MVIDMFMEGVYEKTYEQGIMMFRNHFPKQDVITFIQSVCDIPMKEFLDYIYADAAPYLQAKDVFQFSSFENGTKVLCCKLSSAGCPGIQFLEAGKLLNDDGKERTEGAYTKYGENHLKLATALGLAYERSNTYYLSCYGRVFCDLSENLQKKFMVRLLLRTKAVKAAIQATQNGEVELRQLLSMFSDSTYARRRSNFKTVLDIINDSEEYDFAPIYNRIIM